MMPSYSVGRPDVLVARNWYLMTCPPTTVPVDLLVLASEGDGRITVTVAVAVLFGRAAPFSVALDPYRAELVFTPVLAVAVALPTTVTSNKSSVELLLVYVPVIVAGPCQPLPTFTETFPVALKVSAHIPPIAQVALNDAPGSATFKPGNGIHSELLLNAAANVLVLPLRAIEPVMPDTGSVKPEKGDQFSLLPVLNARLNEY